MSIAVAQEWIVEHRSPWGEQPRELLAINAAFLLEIKQDDDQMPLHLKTVQAMTRSILIQHRPSKRFISQLVRLRDAMLRRFALEEAYGYFRNPSADRGYDSERVHALRDGHSILLRSATELTGQADYIASDMACYVYWPMLLESVRRFCDRLTCHEEQELNYIHSVLPSGRIRD